MQAILFPILAMLFWGVADFLAKIAVNKYGLYRLFFYSYILGTLPLIILYPFFFKPINSLWLLMFFAVGALLNFFGYFVFYKGMEKNEISILSPIVACNSIIAVILSIIFLKEKLSIFYAIGIAIAFIGLFLVSMQGKLKFNKNALYLGLLSMLIWGVSTFALGYLARVSDWFLAALAYRVFTSVYSLALLKEPGTAKIKLSWIWLLFILGLFDMLGTVFYNLGAVSTQLSIAAPISCLYPAITGTLAVIFLREKLKSWQITGIVLILAGLIFINL